MKTSRSLEKLAFPEKKIKRNEEGKLAAFVMMSTLTVLGFLVSGLIIADFKLAAFVVSCILASLLLCLTILMFTLSK